MTAGRQPPGAAAALIQRAAELIKTSANLGGTGRSLSQLEAIAEAVAAERERCAKIAQNGWLWFCPPERCATEDEVEMCKSIAAFITDWALIDREGHQTPCLSALASGAACQPDETLKRCAICGFVVDTKFAADKPTVRMRP